MTSLQFYLTRLAAYLLARLILPLIWWYKPRWLLPWIDGNGWWMGHMLDYAVARAPRGVSEVAGAILWFSAKVGDLVQWYVRWRVDESVRDHVEVLAKAFFTPGGWMMLAQLTGIIFVLIRLRRRILDRRRSLRKEERKRRKADARRRKEFKRTEPPSLLPASARREVERSAVSPGDQERRFAAALEDIRKGVRPPQDSS